MSRKNHEDHGAKSKVIGVFRDLSCSLGDIVLVYRPMLGDERLSMCGKQLR